MRVLTILLVPLFCAVAQTSTTKLEFEAASVKPSVFGPGADGLCRGGPGAGDPTLFTCRYVDLFRIIVRAFGLRRFQVAAPDWTTNQRFDIQASMPAGTTKEQFEGMLRNLLIDRFHLAVHREPREVARYELLVAQGGPKLKDAPDVAAPADEAPPVRPGPPTMTPPAKRPLDKEGYPITTTPGWTMVDGRARFYEPHGGVDHMLLMLEMMLGKPVADATGLKGTYEIEMHWVGESPFSGQMRGMMAQARANAGATAGSPEAAPDPGPKGPSIQQALRDQLGLKLELKKGPVETLVVDHVDKVPTEN